MDTRDFDRDPDRDNSGQTDNGNKNVDKNQQDISDRYSNSSYSDTDWQSQWTDIESDYRKRYPSLTDEDLDYSDDDFDGLSDRIAKRTNRNYQDVQDEIRNWNTSGRDRGTSSDRRYDEGESSHEG